MIIPALLLISLGVLVLYTSDPNLAIQQTVFAAIGIGIYFFIKFFDFRLLKSFVVPIYIISFVLLLVTLILGIETRGSIRWIPIGPFNLQPSEFAKIALILSLANFWSSHLPTWQNIGKSFLIFLPIAVLIFRQPDLGTTLTVGFIWVSLLIASNISKFKLFLLSIFGVISAPLGWLFLQEYQKQRLISFLFPNHDPLGVGYNVIQSTIAIGSGQLLGRGLGRGTQSRLQFLPEFRTDFIFAFIAEELGFIGSFIVLILYSIIFFILFRVLSLTSDRFGELIIIGVVGMLFFQVIVNIGMNIGLLPITGITLPLLSYGGSSMITTLISLGLISSIAKFGLKKKEIKVFDTT